MVIFYQMTASYSKNTGYYQKRADYYNHIREFPLQEENVYINVYSCIVNLYNNFHQFGIQYFELHHQPSRSWEIGLTAIRDIEGLARCWGHAQEITELIERWRAFITFTSQALVSEKNISIEETSELLSDSLESLMNSILEVMPAYVSWIPTAQLEENQPIVDFLQERGNTYRAMGNSKFYAYDRVVDAIASAAIPINDANCVYIKGVGPRIAEHIRNFLSETATPEEESSTDAKETDKSETFVAATTRRFEHLVPSHNSVPAVIEPVQPDHTDECGHSRPGVARRKPFPDIERPAVYNSVNQSLADYLWRCSIDFYWSKQMGRAWAWRRAAETVCVTQDVVQSAVDNQQLPYIGEKMSDVVREFYQYYDVSPVEPLRKRQRVK
uniref:Helix-hairpin-helix domain protein n=1 Tax=Marseillevirus LCMAC201 TaxID=2506605 RepID=A0A481YVM6_9VIRU|nr:MAG: helix-hairpin-helix domain protein [Marseillevirus LCMAC201]